MRKITTIPQAETFLREAEAAFSQASEEYHEAWGAFDRAKAAYSKAMTRIESPKCRKPVK